MNDLVPERAIVPRLFTRSALVMPMPESMIVSVLFVLSGMMWMNSSGCGGGGGAGEEEKKEGGGGRSDLWIGWGRVVATAGGGRARARTRSASASSERRRR